MRFDFSGKPIPFSELLRTIFYTFGEGEATTFYVPWISIRNINTIFRKTIQNSFIFHVFKHLRDYQEDFDTAAVIALFNEIFLRYKHDWAVIEYTSDGLEVKERVQNLPNFNKTRMLLLVAYFIYDQAARVRPLLDSTKPFVTLENIFGRGYLINDELYVIRTFLMTIGRNFWNRIENMYNAVKSGNGVIKLDKKRYYTAKISDNRYLTVRGKGIDVYVDLDTADLLMLEGEDKVRTFYKLSPLKGDEDKKFYRHRRRREYNWWSFFEDRRGVRWEPLTKEVLQRRARTLIRFVVWATKARSRNFTDPVVNFTYYAKFANRICGSLMCFNEAKFQEKDDARGIYCSRDCQLVDYGLPNQKTARSAVF